MLLAWAAPMLLSCSLTEEGEAGSKGGLSAKGAVNGLTEDKQ